MRSRIIFIIIWGFSLSCFASPFTLPKYWGTEKVWWHGRANFSGEVLTPACTLAMEDRWQVVDMGDSTLRELQNTSDGPEKKIFLRLDDCDLSDPKTIGRLNNSVKITFDGISGQNQEQFKIFGSAKGIDLQIIDSMGYKARIGEAMHPMISEQKNKHGIGYLLKMVRNEEELRPGDYYASIKFSINYE